MYMSKISKRGLLLWNIAAKVPDTLGKILFSLKKTTLIWYIRFEAGGYNGRPTLVTINEI